MSTHKRINGNYDITTLGASDVVTISSSAVTVTGNLTVSGTQTTVNSQDTDIQDRVIVLNKGEAGAGVTGGTSGLEVDRGSSTNSRIVYDESNDKWSIDNGSGSLTPIASSAGGLGLENIVEDTTPQLGGSLDVNSQSIVSASNGNVVIAPDGTGILHVDGSAVRLQNEGSDPTGQSGYTTVYSKVAGSGGTGLYTVTDTTTADELVSKSKAVVFGIIF
jgi:hypothetical protein